MPGFGTCFRLTEAGKPVEGGVWRKKYIHWSFDAVFSPVSQFR